MIRIGTRQSKLALVQANMAGNIITRKTGVPCELVPIVTSGDKEKIKPLYDIGGKGLFIKEIEDALLQHEIDIAVHSLKDVPGVIPSELEIVATLEREDARDALISINATKISDLPPSARVGTSSPRRMIYLKMIRPDLKVELMRGNIDTRYQKIISREFDATILACAGIKRLFGQIDSSVVHPIDPSIMLPAIGQGVIALEIRKSDDSMRNICASINHELTFNLMQVERGFLECLEASCRTPAAAYARINGEKVEIDFMLASDSLENVYIKNVTCNLHEGYKIGKMVAEELKLKITGSK